MQIEKKLLVKNTTQRILRKQWYATWAETLS